MSDIVATNAAATLRRALIVVLALCCLAATPARADGCTLVNRDQAERAVELLGAVEQLLYENWFSPLSVHGVRWTRSGFLYQVEVNGDQVLNLSAVYVPAKDGAHFDNLGAMLGCGSGNAPKRISREAFSHQPVLAYRPDEDSWQPPQALEGLLELPELERAWYAGTQQAPAAPVAAYAHPSRDAAVHQRVAAITELPILEYGYERPGAIVLEQREGWYRIALQSGSAWVSSDDAGAFHGVVSLFAENLSYLSVDWDGRLYATPDPAAKSRWLRPVWRRHLGGEIPVKVTETRVVAGMLWLRLAITWPSPCSGGDSSVLASGWVPARSAAKTMNAWYFSRGC